MMKYEPTPIAQAYKGAVDGVERQPGVTFGCSDTAGHPMLPLVNPKYRMSKDTYLTLAYSWNREHTRGATDPRRGVWLGGPKGCGKTVAIEQFYARIGVPVVAITCNRRIPLSDYIQKLVPDGDGGWVSIPGPLIIAMTEGFPVILNEPSAMDPADLIAMHDVIDRGMLVQDDGTVVHAATGFLVHATDNSMGYGDQTGGYPALNSLSTATMSRFLKMEADYPSETEEVAILLGRNPALDPDLAEQFVKFANGMRAPYRQGRSSVTMGTRELIDWVDATEYFQGLATIGRSPGWFALQRVMGGLPPEESTAMRNLFVSVTKTQADMLK